MRTQLWKNVIFGSIAGLSLFVVACDDESPGTGGSGQGGGPAAGGAAAGGAASGGNTSQAADAFCEEWVAHDAACAAPDAITLGACQTDELTICLFGGIREELREAISECIISRPCDAEGDLESCVYTPGEASPVTGQVEFKSACLAAYEDCEGVFFDDACGVNFFEPAGYEALSACLEEADCATIGSCLDETSNQLCAG